MVDPNTVRNHFKGYRQGGIQALAQVGLGGSECWLSEPYRCITVFGHAAFCSASR
jgi:hypothetical protein